jgi:hypothetical protein
MTLVYWNPAADEGEVFKSTTLIDMVEKWRYGIVSAYLRFTAI